MNKSKSDSKSVISILPQPRKLLRQYRSAVLIIVILAAGYGGLALKSHLFAATAVIDTTLPRPSNVKVYVDDQIATVTWDEPTNAQSSGIVGYYLRWNKQGSAAKSSRQTTHTITQIQPLENGAVYDVTVQSVQGIIETRPNGNPDGDGDKYAVANGKVSSPVTVTALSTSARVDQLRQQMTGFFDDFNQPAGAFDELKWNHATSACVEQGEAGAFLNNQFHAHNSVKSTCDRAQIISRPRAIFDITGRTEANPGEIVFDFDGVSQPRDVWYIDLIPTTARKNGVPLDITSHADAFDEVPSDPKMLRLIQFHDKIKFTYYDNNKVPHTIPATFSCADAGDHAASIEWCDMSLQTVPGMSPVAEPRFATPNKQFPVPNVRQHWRLQVSSTKIKLFINSSKIWEGNMPSAFATEKKFFVHNNLFSYNTGKQYKTIMPTTSMLHWDNFGFNGPAPQTVTHNYIEGGPTGTTPYLGRGTVTNQITQGSRSTKINIPDTIGQPSQTRLHFTLQSFGYELYRWNSSHHIIVNGKRYDFPNPVLNLQSPIINDYEGQPQIAEPYVPHATAILVNSADLRQGMNDVSFNISGSSVMNVHLELDYALNQAPAYTSPKQIYTNINEFIIPAMRENDMYLFIEQNMGLTSDDDHQHPPPPPASKRGDVNNDLVVDGSDLAIILSNYGSSQVGRATGDLNADGIINGLDVSEVISTYGT